MAQTTQRKKLQEGMEVYSADNQMLGTIERLEGDGVLVKGQHIPDDAIARVERNRVYLSGAAAQGQTVSNEGEVHVPVYEERLNVQKREAALGEVQVRKEVVQEQQTIPVDLMREEVHIQKVDVQDRPATAADMANAFQEGTIRVPVRGEEAVVTKEAFVTGEVVIDKEQLAEVQQITDTIRKERVEVDENYEQRRAGYQQAYANRRPPAHLPYEQAEPHFRAGYSAGIDRQHAGKSWEEVEPNLRSRYTSAGEGSGGTDVWERLKAEVRQGFTSARER